jgi:hypothetical protein
VQYAQCTYGYILLHCQDEKFCCVPTILFLRILPNIPPIQNNRSFISTKQNKTKQNKTKQNRHIGCICPDGWEGDYCEIKIENIASLTTELIHDVEENLTAGKIVAIIIGVGISIALLYYFKRSLFSCTNTTNNTNANNINSNKRGRGRRGRRGRNKGMELSSSSAAAAAADGRNDNTRDII